MVVTMKFVGALRRDAGKETLALECKKGASLIDLVNELTRELPPLRRNLLDELLEEPKPNALILVNGKEISVLKGLQTIIKDGDVVVFVPVVHGG
jgi:MoaD family protein